MKYQPTDLEKFLYRDIPHYVMEILRRYFRLKVEGIENIPKRGAAILTPNHSGFSGLDAMVLAYEVQRATRRVPKVMTHKFWFTADATANQMNKMGFVEATTENGMSELKKNHLLILFPEGEHGNFKPTTRAYQLQDFKRGFVRMALQTGSPIVPVMILGAEESHINLHQMKLPKILKNMILPLPLNLIPFPAKWKIKILKPIFLPYKASAANDSELVREIADDIREKIQELIRAEISG
jgi:1-acyl-sn-glycerol-3-phosphate acyltransferase